MRLVVNVFKHGEGKSLDDLRQLYPEFVPIRHGWAPNYPDDTDMEVTDVSAADRSALDKQLILKMLTSGTSAITTPLAADVSVSSPADAHIYAKCSTQRG